MKFPTNPPVEYVFTEIDCKKFSGRHYRFPCRLVTDGTWANLWQPSGKKGGGSIASMLPVIALNAYPGAPSIAPPELPGPDSSFTPWASLGIRRLAKLSGLSEKTAASGMKALARVGLAEVRTIPCHEAAGGRKTWYRLSVKLFPGPGEEFSMISGRMVYSGNWAFLPTAAARHLYLTLAALDPVHKEESLVVSMEGELGITEPEEHAEKLSGIRERKAVSWSALVGLAGFGRRTLAETLRILTAPVFDDSIPLVKVGGFASGKRWYAIDNAKRPEPWAFTLDYTNGTKPELAARRRKAWPTLGRVNPPKKRRTKPRLVRGPLAMVGT